MPSRNGNTWDGSEMNPNDQDVFAWRDDNGVVHIIQIIGHRVLARRCEINDADWLAGQPGFQDALTRKYANLADSMLRTYVRHSDTYVAEVLAISKTVNDHRPPSFYQRFTIPENMRRGQWRGRHCFVTPNISCSLTKGDLILLPENSAWQLMWRGVTGSPDDVLVDISEILGYIPAADLEQQQETTHE